MASPRLQLRTTTASSSDGRTAVVLTADGEVDLSTRAQLVHAADQVLAQAHVAQSGRALSTPEIGALLVVHLSRVAFMDCAGLGALVAVVKTATADHLRVAVVVEQAEVLRLLALTGLDHTLPLTASLQIALTS